MRICHIIGAADIQGLIVDRRVGDLVVSVDGGFAHLQRFSIAYDVAIGDFDSLGFTPERAISFPAEKDDTDTMLAIRHGLGLGFKRFALYGCLGGALSHTLANLQSLAFILRSGARGALIGEGTYALLVSGGALSISLPLDMKISVLAFGGEARGVTLEGFKYPLKDAVLTVDYPIGISNAPIGTNALIAVKQGILAVILEGVMRDPLRLLL